MKEKAHLIVSVSFIFILLFLNGCTSEKTNNKLRIGLVQWIGYAPLYVAEHDKKLPQNLRIIDFTSNYDIIEAMKEERLEGAFLTIDEVLKLIQKGVKLKVLYAIDTSNGADAILAKQSIANIKELKNKRVAYEPQSVQEYLLFRALEKNGMQISDIKSVLCKFDRGLDLRKKDAFDGVVTFEPLKHKLLATGLHTLFSSRDIPNEIVDLFVVTEAALKNNRKTLIKTLQVLLSAAKKIQKDRSTDTIVADYLQTTPDALKNAYDGIVLLSKETNLHLLSGKKPALLRTIKHIKRFHKIDTKQTDLDTFIDSTLLKEVH